MKVREILDNVELVKDFDFFNDYKDTRQWLLGGASYYPEDNRWSLAIEALNAGYRAWSQSNAL